MKFTLVKNNLPEAKEPYRGQFISNGTIEIDAFADGVAKGRTNVDAATVKMIMRTAFEVIGEKIAEDLTRIDTGMLAFEPAISGSVATMDGALTDENEAYIAIRVRDSLKREIAAITPSRVANETTGGISIDYVFNISTGESGQITNTEPFRVLGRKISASDTESGEELYLIDSAGTKHVANLLSGDEVMTHGQRIDAHFMSPPSDRQGYARTQNDRLSRSRQRPRHA
jgi:hypothetical protein